MDEPGAVSDSEEEYDTSDDEYDGSSSDPEWFPSDDDMEEDRCCKTILVHFYCH